MEEQMRIHRQRNDSFDSVDLEFPNRAEFRGQGKVHSGEHHAISDTTDDLPNVEVKLNTVEKESDTIAPEVVKT
jgi:hypothetical protein